MIDARKLATVNEWFSPFIPNEINPTTIKKDAMISERFARQKEGVSRVSSSPSGVTRKCSNAPAFSISATDVSPKMVSFAALKLTSASSTPSRRRTLSSNVFAQFAHVKPCTR
ncbi:hypothetical protein HNQ41_002357 [Texcoconibacillus texcoconensis]|uniref:Uncharacterized protein n=1 Tax=Texcoconibacillus texcoconensis TaxID=1095777 RepID=A0A840QS68_9BACI|nr:hypothetical protein [Texcoconibacillus texcoconensis]